MADSKTPAYLQKLLRKMLLQILCTFTFLLSCVGDASAQVCGVNLSLETQAEVDSVGATGCDRVLGNLTIISYYSTNITNLNGLSNLTLVGGV